MGAHHHHHTSAGDLAILEQAFIAGFTTAHDPQAFLKLAGIALQLDAANLVDVRVEHTCTVGVVSPGFATTDLAYQPLPHELTQKSSHVVFVYVGRDGPKQLSFADVAPATAQPSNHHHHGELV